jgi:hypothetical protein
MVKQKIVDIVALLFTSKLDSNFIFQRKVEEEANLEAIWGGSWKNEVLEVKRKKNQSFAEFG